MTEKRYLLKYSEFETSNGEIIQAEPYFIDTKEEYVDTVYFTMDGYPTMSYKQVLDLLNENEQLKNALKNSYFNEICENCKSGHYFLSDNFDGGFEGDFECKKGHDGADCDGLKDCDDFELRY